MGCFEIKSIYPHILIPPNLTHLLHRPINPYKLGQSKTQHEKIVFPWEISNKNSNSENLADYKTTSLGNFWTVKNPLKEIHMI